jgi:hypothetical protein
LSVVFFTDRDLGNRFPDILAASGLAVERHRDHFPHDCPDEEWLRTVGANGWVAITHDARIRYKPNELAAVIRHRVTLLVVVGQAPFADLARNFVATAPKILRFLGHHQPPLIAKVYRPTPAEVARNANAAGSVMRRYPP